MDPVTLISSINFATALVALAAAVIGLRLLKKDQYREIAGSPPLFKKTKRRVPVGLLQIKKNDLKHENPVMLAYRNRVVEILLP